MKKVWKTLFVIAAALALYACLCMPTNIAGNETKEFVVAGDKYEVPVGFPECQRYGVLNSFPLYNGNDFKILTVEAANPDNTREFVLLLICFEHVGNEYNSYLFMVMHSVIPVDKDPVTTIYIDKEYLETGNHSGKLVVCEDTPSEVQTKAFIEKAEHRLAPKEKI